MAGNWTSDRKSQVQYYNHHTESFSNWLIGISTTGIQTHSGILSVYWWLTTWSEERLLQVSTTPSYQETLGSFQGEMSGKVESRCAPSSRQCTCPHACWCGFELLIISLFTRSGTVWLRCISIFERFVLQTNIWQRLTGYPCDKWLVWTAGQKVLHRLC